MKELFELLQINSELFGPNQPQTSSNSDPERISTPQPSEGQESSSYESQYDGRLGYVSRFIKFAKVKKNIVSNFSLLLELIEKQMFK